MHKNILDKYVSEGYAFFNTGSKEKKVLTKWTEFQNRKPTSKEITHWLNAYSQNYAIVCGEISNIVVFDVDTKNGGDPTPFLNRGMREIRTPSGGYHFYVKYDSLLASTKHKKSLHKGILFAVDVQSNGSIVFAPPTKFANGAYTVANDVPVTACPDDLLMQVVAALEPEKVATDYVPFKGISNPSMGRPGDIFNSLMTWEDVLIPLGWTKVGRTSVITYWRRPGKSDGISASTGWKEYDLFFPFTTSIPELEPMKGYTKFRLYAVLVHGGDFAKAAKALVVENYKHVMNRI
jgi:hypothetical protein